eukprot:1154354-Pelagomonas_calceolata.AAC.4
MHYQRQYGFALVGVPQEYPQVPLCCKWWEGKEVSLPSCERLNQTVLGSYHLCLAGCPCLGTCVNTVQCLMLGVGGYAVAWQNLEDTGVTSELLVHLNWGVGTSLWLRCPVFL